MREYHKIQSIFLRDPATNHKTFLMGQYSEPSFEYLAGNRWLFEEKIDGTNIRVHWNGERVVFGGRTDNASIPAPLMQFLTETFTVDKLKLFDGAITLYGEGYGAKIQKGGGNYRADQSFILFDVCIGNLWLERTAVTDIALKLGIDVCPAYGSGSIAEAINIVSKGFKSAIGVADAEGLILRPMVELLDRRGNRIITKLKTKDFN